MNSAFNFLLGASLAIAALQAPVWAQPVIQSKPYISAAAKDTDIVCFNVSNNKYHSTSCTWAKRCTKHCIEITRAEAHRRGGVPCKVCGGGE